MEILCVIHNCGETVEKPWRKCGELQMWSICGESTRWKITGWKIPKRARMELYTKQIGKVEKMFRKIMNWMNTREGKGCVAGIIFGVTVLTTIRILMFFACLISGYPASPWKILFWL